MYNNRSHPLLEQVPLTVSPFVSLPAATTLSYNYKPMPSTLPPPSTGVIADGASGTAASNKPKYVISPSGHAAHPDDIIASCRALREHVAKIQADAERELRELEERIKSRELAEKRRVAPGWLDSEARLLEPDRAESPSQHEQLQGGGYAAMAPAAPGSGMPAMTAQFQGMALSGPGDAMTDEGAQLDRAFGGMQLK